jgi:hypothetical protein
MSETLDNDTYTGHEPVTEDDLRRMLAESRGQIDALTRERDTERSTRQQTAQELEAERAARAVTEQERDGATARATTEAEQRWNAQKNAVKAGIAVQQGVAAKAEDDLARHAELGDWKAHAKAQRELAEAAAKLDRLQAEQDFLESNKEKLVPPVQQAPRPQPRPAPQDRIAEVVGGQLFPGEREWLQQRPKFLADDRYQKEVFAASNLAVARGYPRGTEAYFKDMQKTLGEDQQQRQDDQQPRQPQDRGMSSDLAPQRRAAPGQNPPGRQEWTLTADEAEVADGLYGQPNSPDYIADRGARMKHYYDMKERRRAAGRM